ncbi:MAG: DUF4124 domain-containing protein [Woeseia sp.]
MTTIRKNTIACLSMLVTLAAGMAFAGEIYRWTDEQGNVHYVDRPTGEPTEERLDISSKPTDPAKVQARLQQRREARAAAAQATASAPEGPTEEELRAQALERQEQCDSYKARLQKFLTSRRLYKLDDNGDRVYLDEDEMLAARERVQSQVEEFCDS